MNIEKSQTSSHSILRSKLATLDLHIICLAMPFYFPTLFLNKEQKAKVPSKPNLKNTQTCLVFICFVLMPKKCPGDELEQKIHSSEVYFWSWKAENGKVRGCVSFSGGAVI